MPAFGKDTALLQQPAALTCLLVLGSVIYSTKALEKLYKKASQRQDLVPEHITLQLLNELLLVKLLVMQLLQGCLILSSLRRSFCIVLGGSRGGLGGWAGG